MTPQEKDLITSLLTRLQQAAGQAKDAEAAALIERGLADQPDAPYLLVQTVLIEDLALAEAHRRIKALEDQLAAKSATPAAAPASFLGSAGRGSVPAAGPWGQPNPPPSGPVWTQSGGNPAAAAYPPAPQPMPAPLTAPSATSGFLRQAASTAAGIAGGALLFQGIQSLFGSHYGSGFLGGMPMQPGLGESVVNNYYNSPDQAPADFNPADPAFDPGSGDPGAIQADDSQDSGQDFSADQDLGGSGDGGSFDV